MASKQRPVRRCFHCSREFARSEHLIRHERTHTKEKPFWCQLCENAFSRRDLLRRHEKKAHGQRLQAIDRPASQQSLHLTRSVEQLSLPTSPTRIENGPQSNLVPYLVMPAEETSPLGQNTLNQASVPSHGLLEAEPWTTGSIPDWTSPDLDTNPYVQEYFLPDQLSRSDSFPASNSIHGINLCDLPHLSQIPLVSRSNHVGNRYPNQIDRRSILSRPSSPPPPQGFTYKTANGSLHSISEEYRQFMQQEISKSNSSYVLPSRDALSQFIQRYFKSFHQHQPFLHEPTWSPQESPVPLVLAVCANGAVYNLERKVAADLHRAAVELLKLDDQGVWTLQTMMLLTAFAAWSGEMEDLRLALQFLPRLTLNLRQEWSLTARNHLSSKPGWEGWRDMESLKRVTYCIFTLVTLMMIAFDFPSPIYLEDKFGLPHHEVQWCADSEEAWLNISAGLSVQEWQSAEAVVRRLGDDSLPTPTNLGMFGCHVTITTLLQKIVLFRKSCSSNGYGFEEVRQHYLRALRRWQMMWESEPESSLSPDYLRGPILFNCTAILRVAYIRLVTDYSLVRAAFSICSFANEVELTVRAVESPRRDPPTTRAVLQACLALRIPIHLGFKVVARTSFWIWSVQHALCYFECALLLAKWLEAIENETDLTENEQGILSLVQRLLHASGVDGISSVPGSLPAAVLRSWARLLDTEDTTVWQIVPKMAQALKLYAENVATN